MKINRLKTTYQRNLLIGQAVSCLTAGVIVLLTWLTETEYVVIDIGNNSYITSLSIPKTESWEMPNESERKELNIPPDNDNFVVPGPSIVKTYRDEMEISDGLIYSVSHNIEFVASDEDKGELIDYGGDILSMTAASDSSISDKSSNQGNYDYDNLRFRGNIPHPGINTPLMINFPAPFYPNRLRYKVDAVVTLGFYLTEKGTITQIDVIKEEPVGFGFALAVKEALRDSWIKPAVINGKKKGGYYILTYEFCEKCPSRPAVIESSPNVVVTIK